MVGSKNIITHDIKSGVSPVLITDNIDICFWAQKIPQPTNVSCDIRCRRCGWLVLIKKMQPLFHIIEQKITDFNRNSSFVLQKLSRGNSRDF